MKALTTWTCTSLFVGSLWSLVLCVMLLTPSSARAEYPGMGCSWKTGNVPVYFNPGTLAANGFDPDDFRQALINSMQVWNAESESGVWFYYAGDTSEEHTPGKLVVTHQDTWSCSDNALAKAFGFGNPPSDCADKGTIVRVILRDSCTSAIRDWQTGWPTNTSGAIGYEAVMVHELGHTGMGFPDVVSSAAVMDGTYGNHHEYLHLYPIDLESAAIQYEPTSLQIRTRFSVDDGTSWSLRSTFDTGIRTTTQPGLDSRPGSNDSLALSAVDASSAMADFRRGFHDNWTALGTTPPNGAPGSVQHWVNVAYSSYGETLLVWPASCLNVVGCSLRWAWSADEGSSWTTGTLTTFGSFTFARPEVAYDPARDTFVIAFIDATTGRIKTAWTTAWDPVWSTTKTSSQGAEVFRYLGGLVFPISGDGLLTATTGVWSPPNLLVQSSVEFDGSDYIVGWSLWALDSTYRPIRQTRRHFGMARRADTGEIVLVWRDQFNDEMCTARKSTTDPTVPFTWMNCSYSIMDGGPDIAFSAATSAFVTAFSYW